MAYHISKDGVSRQCRAKSLESCTATSSDQKEHYDTKEEAQAAYEKHNQKESVQSLKKPTTDNLRALNKTLREANHELIELEDEYETAWNDRRKEIEIEISDKKAVIKEMNNKLNKEMNNKLKKLKGRKPLHRD